MPKVKGGFYAVHTGKVPGIYSTWEDCQQQVLGFPKAKYKKFRTEAEAEAFVQCGSAEGSVARAAATSSTKSQTRVDGVSSSKNTYIERKMGKGMSQRQVYGPEWSVVYTDGACQGNGKHGAVAGVGVWWGNNDSRNFAERCPGAQTNNRAELIAIIRALETASKDIKRLLIRTDSSYSIQCIQAWMPLWRKREWKTATGTDVKNKAVIMYLAHLLDEYGQQGRLVRLQHVRGHAGEEGNEGADGLATIGTLMSEQPERSWTIPVQLNLTEVGKGAEAAVHFDVADLLDPADMQKMVANGDFD